MVVYGRASLVSGFQLTPGNDDLLSLRHKQIFAVTHPVHILKCGFPTKGIEVTRLNFFESSRVLSFEGLGLDHFGSFSTKICRIQVKL